MVGAREFSIKRMFGSIAGLDQQCNKSVVVFAPELKINTCN